MFGWFKRKPKQVSSELASVADGKCPDCQGDLLCGPTGGVGMNALCENCHEEYLVIFTPIPVIHSRLGKAGVSRKRIFGVDVKPPPQ